MIFGLDICDQVILDPLAEEMLTHNQNAVYCNVSTNFKITMTTPAALPQRTAAASAPEQISMMRPTVPER